MSSGLQKLISDHKKYPLFVRAKTAHKSHKGESLIIKKGSYLEQIYKDNNPSIAIRKATQGGLSEYLIVRSIWRAEQGKSVFYVMPTFDLKNQFVRERYDRSINNTDYYRKIIGESEVKQAESMSLKQIGKGVIAFVGSNTSNSFVSFPADDVIIDEYDQCNQVNLAMAEERQSNSKDKTRVDIGNPTITDFGIDREYKESCRYTWMIKCSHCGYRFTPDFFKDIVKQADSDIWLVQDPEWKPNGSHLAKTYCRKCGKPYNRFMPGEWVAEKEHPRSGYFISKMFSTQNTTNELIKRFQDGLGNDTIMQRFYNGDLGLPFVSKGAKIDTDMLNDCIDPDYYMPDGTTKPCMAGVDVGSVFNIVIAEIETGRMVYIGELPVHDIKEIKDLFKKYNVKVYVIDALPETRISRQIVAQNKTGFMSYFAQGKNELTINVKGNIITSNRTVTLDAVKEAIITKQLILPANAMSIPGFTEQMTASTRIYNEDKNTFLWVESGADHYFTSSAYLLLAKKIIVMAQ